MDLDLLQSLAEMGGVLDGHFILSGGMHSPQYLCVDPLLAKITPLYDLMPGIVGHFRQEHVDAFAAPAIGGIAVVQQAASSYTFHYEPNHEVHAVWADKVGPEGKQYAFTGWGFTTFVGEGKQVVIMEDVITEGGAVGQVCDLVRKCGGTILGVAALFNRGDVTAETLKVPVLHCLQTVNLPKYPADQCPLCEARVPIVLNHGRGWAYQESHTDYIGRYVELRYV